MKLWTSEHTFNHPWQTVVQAACQKYPNPLNKGVVAVDVIDRSVKDSKLSFRRLMTTTWGFPEWIVKLVGLADDCYVDERIVIDSKLNEMKVLSKNLTFCDYMIMSEKLIYSKDPNDPEKTHLVQETSVRVNGLPMTGYLENLIQGSCTSNTSKGRLAIEWVISHLKNEAQELTQKANHEMDHLKQAANSEIDNLKRKANNEINNLKNMTNSNSDKI